MDMEFAKGLSEILLNSYRSLMVPLETSCDVICVATKMPVSRKGETGRK